MAQAERDDDHRGERAAGCGRRGRPAALPEPQLREWHAYRAALDGSRLARGTRQVYASRLRQFLAWQAAAGPSGAPLDDPAARDRAVAAFIDHLRTAHGCKPGTINNYLAALDHYFANHRGLGPASARRQPVPSRPPTVLDGRARGRFHAAAHALRSPRDAAICLLLVHSGMTMAELAALDVTDIVHGERHWHLVVRGPSGGVRRLITLPYGEVHDALRRWLRTRAAMPLADPGETALFVSRRGTRLAERTLRSIVTSTAARAGLAITPRQLRTPPGRADRLPARTAAPALVPSPRKPPADGPARPRRKPRGMPARRSQTVKPPLTV